MEANYAFDNGVLTLALTEVIEQSGKHGVNKIVFFSISISILPSLISHYFAVSLFLKIKKIPAIRSLALEMLLF
ncbi:hypothetical protein [Hyella patelloides]|uniref:hypothetical protein n=1 Tax=Hyella patelloides TaxID=1982969 RepID=UPI00119FFB58|nr:hypothetical protein [Hyella patelloides]